MAIPVIPNVSDNLFKTVFAIGVLLMGVGVYYIMQTRNKILSLYEESYLLESEIGIQDIKLNTLRFKTLDASKLYARKIGVESPIYEKDSFLLFKEVGDTLNSPIVELDSFTNIYMAYRDSLSLYLMSEKQFISKLRIAKKRNKAAVEDLNYSIVALLLGFIFVFAAGYSLWKDYAVVSDLEYNKLRNEYLLMPKGYSNCQSCGVKFTSMVSLSKEKDGEINRAFCRECYTNGEFTNKEITIDEMVENVMYRLGKPLSDKKAYKKCKTNILNKERWQYYPYKQS